MVSSSHVGKVEPAGLVDVRWRDRAMRRRRGKATRRVWA